MKHSLSQPAYAAEINRRIVELEKLTTLECENIAIPLTDVHLQVIRPADIDALLDDVVDDPEQNLPYWAEIWPSGIALAAVVLRDSTLIKGVPVIELGCGLGVTAAAAMMVGAQLVATDYSPYSLRLTELTCLLAGLKLPAVRQNNWRSRDARLMQDSGEPWPIVLAADVLYEDRDIEPILKVLEGIVAINGTALLAEPGRRPARDAIHRAHERGWQIETETFDGPWPDPDDTEVVVSVHKLHR